MTRAASYFDGVTAKVIPASVTFDDTDLVIDCENGSITRWSLVNVRLVDPPGDGQQTRLRNLYDQPDRLTLPDDFDLDELRSRCPDLSKGNTGWSRNWRRISLWLGGALLSIAFLIFVAIPMVSHQIAQNLPQALMTRIGEQAKEQIITVLAAGKGVKLDGLNICTGPSARDLKQMVKSLSGGFEEAPPLSVEVINLDIKNAFALPGGNILVFRGLLEELKHPNELAGILGHEMAHAYYRHPTEGFFKEIGSFAIIGLVFGDVTGGAMLAGLGKLLIGSAYSRDAERQSDEMAVTLMNKADFDARPMATFMTRLYVEQGKIEDLFSIIMTHPGSQDRADRIDELSKGANLALSLKKWQALKTFAVKYIKIIVDTSTILIYIATMVDTSTNTKGD